MRGWDFLWRLAPTALWGFILIPRRNKLPRSPILPQAGASHSLPLAPAPLSATEPSDTHTDGKQSGVAVPAPSEASVATLSARELDAMRINREAVERLYSVKARGPVREEIAFRVIDEGAA